MSSLRVRMSYRFLSSVGATQTSLHSTFDQCHDQYQKLRTSTIQFRELLQRYLGQIAELHETTERLAIATEGFFVEGDPNNGLATSFREFCWESRYGLISHFVDGIKKGVLEPFDLWQREIDKAQEHVDGFQDIRLKYDHYRLKVKELSQKMEAEFGRNAKTVEKYNRNALKLQETTKEYKAVSEEVCKHLVLLLRKRYTTLNPIFIRFVQFLQMYYAHWNLLATDLSATFEPEIQSIEPMGLESFVPKTAVKHHEGLLHKKGQMGVRDRELFCQLVGSTLLMFDNKQQARVGEPPHKIADVAYVTEWDGKGNLGFGLVNGEGREYYFWTETEEQRAAWLAALERARTWDGMASKDNINEKLEDLRNIRQTVQSTLKSNELLPHRYKKRASQELNLPNLTSFEENVELPVEASVEGAMSQIQAAIMKGGPPTHPKLNANSPAPEAPRQSLISKIIPFGRGEDDGPHRASSTRRPDLGAIPEGEEAAAGTERPESMSSTNSDAGFFGNFKRAVSRKLGSGESTPERSTSPPPSSGATPPPPPVRGPPPRGPPPPPPPRSNRMSETELERPSEWDFGDAPEVGEDVYMVFSQLAGAEYLVFEQLFQWPELNELLQTNALSMDDVQELWVQATFLGPDGVRRMDAKGFDAFVSLCDERQLVNQGGV